MALLRALAYGCRSGRKAEGARDRTMLALGASVVLSGRWCSCVVLELRAALPTFSLSRCLDHLPLRYWAVEPDSLSSLMVDN